MVLLFGIVDVFLTWALFCRCICITIYILKKTYFVYANAVDFDIVFVTDTGITIDGDFAGSKETEESYLFHLVFKFRTNLKSFLRGKLFNRLYSNGNIINIIIAKICRNWITTIWEVDAESFSFRNFVWYY